MSKDEGSIAAKATQQVDNAVYWLQKRYFAEGVRVKKRVNKSAQLAKANKNDKNSLR
jgi:phage host-nuclease inhibitor protein Gam